MKRNTQTKSKLKKALITLLEKVSLEEITVSDLTRMSNINRGTFYIHYLDKYDLIEKLEEDILIELENIFNSQIVTSTFTGIIPNELILNALYYIREDLPFVNALVADNGDPKFVSKFKNLIGSTIKKYAIAYTKKPLPIDNIPSDYATEILLSSLTSILLLWIKKGGAESPEVILNYIDFARNTTPFELLNLK